jgi:hypothetical protein
VSLPTVPVESAALPALYESAKLALSECSRIDECQNWADKAAAMASYAKQAKDETLQRYAERIKARAITRCGELLKAIQPASGNQYTVLQEGALPKQTREQAAEDAGLSEHQRKTALRVANVDPEVREALIESDNPPTITELAEMGKKPRNIVDLGEINPRDYALATTAQGTLREFAAYCKSNDPIRIAKAFQPHEVAAMRRYVSAVDSWLDSFVVHLEG